jgi:hypothetical protein
MLTTYLLKKGPTSFKCWIVLSFSKQYYFHYKMNFSIFKNPNLNDLLVSKLKFAEKANGGLNRCMLQDARRTYQKP